MIEQLFFADQTQEPVRVFAVILGLLLAFICGQALSWTYMYTHSGFSYSRTYVSSLVVMPILVAMVMMVLSNNLITAFGLMALFAIVRFRNILRDTLDTCYILAGITLGMACGTGRYATAAMGLALICGVLIYLAVTSFGQRHRYDFILNLRWNRPVEELPRLADLLRRHAVQSICASQHVHPEANGADLSYRLVLRDPSRWSELVNEVREVEGASEVSGLSAQDESEM